MLKIACKRGEHMNFEKLNLSEQFSDAGSW